MPSAVRRAAEQCIPPRPGVPPPLLPEGLPASVLRPDIAGPPDMYLGATLGREGRVGVAWAGPEVDRRKATATSSWDTLRYGARWRPSTVLGQTCVRYDIRSGLPPIYLEEETR